MASTAPTPPPALPIVLLFCLLASSAASAAPAAPDSHHSPSSHADSNPGLSMSTGERVASAPLMDSIAAATSGDSEEGEDAAAEAGHKIQVRDAGRFWSGSRYGRSGRSVGAGGASESQTHGGGRSGGSTFGMAMALRSSGPVIQPRHDRFFLGSRYGKRAQGPRSEWRRAGDEEEEEESGEQQEERAGGGIGEEDTARTVKEALRLRAFPGDSEEVFGVTSQRLSSALQPTSCIYMGMGNLYRCYEGRREGGVH
ncbi:uncharacterized protein [Hetaerina americana]|uniref:uncharacterized protein n=1 Tax=Hetaerina americana TaxID=62018 RepID=UPI003A7F3F93